MKTNSKRGQFNRKNPPPKKTSVDTTAAKALFTGQTAKLIQYLTHARLSTMPQASPRPAPNRHEAARWHQEIPFPSTMKLNLIPALVFACGFSLAGIPAFATPIPDDCRTGGIAIGCQAWTFNQFSVMEAIDKTAAAGGKVIEFYPGQKFSPDQPDLKFDHNATDEMIAAVKAKLAERGIRAVNYGVVGIPKNEADARKIFEFAKKLGLYGITTESVDAIDTIEKLVKEYDICVGFHDHQRQPDNPVIKCGIRITF